MREQLARSEAAVRGVEPALQRVHHAGLLERQLGGDRPAVEGQEREPQPAALGGPPRDLRVEVPVLPPRRDRRPGSLLPPRGFELHEVVERARQAARGCLDLDAHVAGLLQAAPAPGDLLAVVLRQPLQVVVEAALDRYVRRVPQGLEQCEPAALAKALGERRGDGLRRIHGLEDELPAELHRGTLRELGGGGVIHSQRAEDRRVRVGGSAAPPATADDGQGRDQLVAAPDLEQRGTGVRVGAAPRLDPARTHEWRRPDTFGERVPLVVQAAVAGGCRRADGDVLKAHGIGACSGHRWRGLDSYNASAGRGLS